MIDGEQRVDGKAMRKAGRVEASDERVLEEEQAERLPLGAAADKFQPDDVAFGAGGRIRPRFPRSACEGRKIHSRTKGL